MSKSFIFKVYKFVPVLIVMLIFSPIIFTYGKGKMVQIYNYIVYIILSVLVFGYYWKNRNNLSRQYKYITSLYVLMIIYVVASCIKLFFVPSAIYPFQRMQVMCSFLSVGTVFVLMHESILVRTFKLWWKYVPIIVLPASVMMDKFWLIDMFQVSFLFLMLSNCINKSKKYVVFFMFLYMALYGISQRFDYLRVLLPFVVLLLIKFHFFLGRIMSKILYGCLMLIPIVLFLLALNGKFNVFDMDSYIEGSYISSSGENMKDDTRTMLYEEALNSAMDNNYLWYGRTPGYGYDSKFVANREGTFYAESGVFPQRNSEVFVVNMFTWTGVIGLSAWFMFFIFWGLKVLNRARNRYIRALTIYVGFFWICDWISNYFVAPSSTYMLLFMVIAICSQRKYQLMSDLQIESYFKRIFR